MSVSNRLSIRLGEKKGRQQQGSIVRSISQKIVSMIKMTSIGVTFLLVLATLFGGDVADDVTN